MRHTSEFHQRQLQRFKRAIQGTYAKVDGHGRAELAELTEHVVRGDVRPDMAHQLVARILERRALPQAA